MKLKPLPQELAGYSYLPHLRQVGNHEWSSACPQANCGEHDHDPSSGPPDRFRMWEADHRRNMPARGWCRRCGFFTTGDKQTDPEVLARFEEERRRMQQIEQRRIRERIGRLQDEAYWRGWHDAMTETQRQFWREAGIPDSAQDMLQLGYNPAMDLSYFEQDIDQAPALTIPYFNRDGEAVNIQSRLLHPFAGKRFPKYLFLPSLPVPLYLTDFDKPVEGQVFIFEGVKKAINAYLTIGHAVDGPIVGTHSSNPSPEQIAQLDLAELVVVCLDPDATEKGQADRLAARIGQDRTRIVTMPVKFDDAIVEYGMTARDLLPYIRDAREPLPVTAFDQPTAPTRSNRSKRPKIKVRLETVDGQGGSVVG